MVKAPPVQLRRLQITHGAAAALSLGPLVAGILLTQVDQSGGIPGWVAVVPVVIVAIVALLAVRYWRRRPIPPGDWDTYAQTARFRIAVALTPAVTGLLFAPLAAEGWIAAVGSLFSLVALAVAPTSEADYERHQELYLEQGEIPADEMWGAAGPDEVAPWDDEHGDHGHGLGHHH
jgi:hypothetical protein